MARWALAWERVPAEVRLRRLYDQCAAFVVDGGLRWDEFWSIPSVKLNRYANALNRLDAKRAREAEAAARKK